MGFSFPFLKSRQNKQEYLGLYLTDSSAYGFLFSLADGKETIITQNTFSLTVGFENILEDIDNLISDIELKTNAHVDQTIFFLHSWMIDEETLEIKDPYKGIIQKLSKDLELKPLGYIDVEEALLRNLKSQAILNAVSIEVNKSKLGVFIYKGGVKVHNQYTARTDEVGDDIASVLEGLPKHVVVPNKLFIYGDDDKAEVSSDLATYDWDESIFPEHPTLEVVKQQEINKALMQVFAKEMGSEGQDTDTKSTLSSEEPKADTSGSMGFVIGKDIVKDGMSKSDPTSEPIDAKPATLHPFSQFIQKMKGLSSGNKNNKSKMFALFGGIALVLILGIVGYEYFLHTLKVTVYLKANTVEETLELELTIKEESSKELAVVKKSVKSAFSEQKKATGAREIGEKAMGKVVVHNWDTGERAFTRGTELSYNGLIFTLDTDIKVASASSVTSAGLKESGKTKVDVTAAEIGKKYNIANGTQLNVGSLPESLYLAIADGAFKGGVSETITTVSKKDMDTLEQQVEDLAKEGSDDVLGTSISKDDVLLSTLTSSSLGKTTFSAELGEEAELLTLKAESEIEFYSLSDKLFKKELIILLEKKLKDGFTVGAEGLEYSIEDIEEDGDTAFLSVNTKANSFKKIDTKKILGISTGTSQQSLITKIKSLYEVEDVELSGILWTPFFSKNITIETKLK